MMPPDETPAPVVCGNTGNTPPAKPRIPARFGLMLLALLACFGRPLYELAVFSFHSDLYSHIVLIPFISLYLVWTNRPDFNTYSAPNRRIALTCFAFGALLIGGYWAAIISGAALAQEDSLALLVLAFVFIFAGICGWFLGQATLKTIAFPLGFMVFMAPLPVDVVNHVESFLQHTSAAAALGFFKLSGTPVFHHDLVFQLPGITLEVAPECSGIRSSMALFITSIVAGHLFLRTPWKKAVLTLAVIPLAILRNGFRVFTIGELCVQISPDMINSYIHRRGGPLFFILSLLPFFLLLRYLYRTDRIPSKQSTADTP